jgi:AAA domain-containing protein
MDFTEEDAQAQQEAEQEYGDDFDEKEPGFDEGFSILKLSGKPIPKDDILLGNRYLCVACILFIVAPSGLGKSTLAIQIAILFACGLAALGIPPARQLRVLIVQAEDDLGDCIEMARMINHLGLSEKQKHLVGENTKVIQCNTLILGGFVRALEKELKAARDQGKPWDIIIINPYSTYLGGDPKDDKLCSQFLCQLLQPVLTAYRVAAIIIHHTPKTNFQNTDDYKIWDWMYWGAGCAKITNVARAILAIKPLDDEAKVFRFIAAKRGQRIGEEWEGHFERYFAHSSDPNLLRWEEATDEQIAKATISKSKAKFADLDKVCQCVPLIDPELKTAVESRVRQKCAVSRDEARAALNELCVRGRIFERSIPNPKPKTRGFAAWCRTNGSDTPPGNPTESPSGQEIPS